MGGAVRHLTNFLPALARHDTVGEYHVLVRESFRADKALPANIRLRPIPDATASGWLRRVAFDNIQVNRTLRREGFDTLVSLTNFGPLAPPARHVFFQRNPLYYCRHYLDMVQGRIKAETLLRRQLAVEIMKRCDVVVAPTQGMIGMILETCPRLKDRRFQVLYHGYADEGYREPLEDRFRKLFDFSGLKLLYPTHPARHKGFEVLFRILARLKGRRDFRLYTTICREDWPEVVLPYEREIRRLGLEREVVFTGRIPQQQMGEVYRLCDVMIYPSLCESFGFSMVEAMGSGLPIVAAGTCVNREICGAAALYYPPEDDEKGCAAILEVLEGHQRRDLAAKGRERIAGFDWGWDRYAREFLKIVVGTGSPSPG